MISQKGNKLYIGGKMVGIIHGKNVVMRRSPKHHFYRVLNAWCVNTEILPFAEVSLVIEISRNKFYVISLARLEQLRSRLNMYVTFGQERQLAIPLECWDVYSSNAVDAMPASIGVSPLDFVENAPGRWVSRIIAQAQIEIPLQ